MSIESNSKQTRICQKKKFCCFNFENSEIGQKLDGKAENEEKIDGDSEMLPPCAPSKYSSIKEFFYQSIFPRHLENTEPYYGQEFLYVLLFLKFNLPAQRYFNHQAYKEGHTLKSHEVPQWGN